ncbi:MAG: TRAP transporter TatT component family protein [Gammaproteobacteria bacterium]|nr:TRAP transporter TatT component family protein [Gammaproteobacteria bacterium]
MTQIIRLILLFSMVLLSSACSMNTMLVRASLPMIEGGITAMNRETDLELAKAAFPANIEMLEGMMVNDPSNETLREYAAQGYYGFAFGFVEDENKVRASKLYFRGYLHGIKALERYGLSREHMDNTLDNLQLAVNQLDEDATAALFWTASNLTKWVDMNRDSVESLSYLPRAVMLMERVLELDENYFMAGPHLYFGAYYGSRAPMLGGDFKLSEQHFNYARQHMNNRILMADLLQAQYLERQRFDEKAFNKRLTKVISAADDLYPDQALINAIAKHKASLLLEEGKAWF